MATYCNRDIGQASEWDSEMSNESLIVVYEKFSNEWQRRYTQQDYRGAISCAVNLYLRCKEAKDDALETAAIGLISLGCKKLLQLDDSRKENVCSFCGRQESEAMLYAGHTAFICESCIETLSQASNPSKKS